MSAPARLARWSVVAGSAAATLATAHTLLNLNRLRTPSKTPPTSTRRVSALIPARDEAANIGQCVASVVEQAGAENVEVLVLNDRSTDGTDQVIKHFTPDGHVTLIDDAGEPPQGWLGKNWACWNLAQRATGDVLVFLDADVVLEPHALAACLDLLEQPLTNGSVPVAVSPYPRQVANGSGPRLVQPLLQWSWLTFLPLRLAETSPRPSLVAANGQLLAITREAYDSVDGHRGVRAEVIEDVALFRNLKRQGQVPLIADGTSIATCHMYDDWPALREGYTKSLWSAFGSKAGAAGVVGLLSLMYVVPPIAALRGSRIGMVGYAAGVAGRVAVAHRVNGRLFPDALAHPASVVTLAYLTAQSLRTRSRGHLQWKGRPIQ